MIVDKGKLISDYINGEYSIQSIADKYNVSYGFTWNLLNANKLQKKKFISYDIKIKSFTINKSIKSYLDGLIIGDGCISNELPYPRYTQQNCSKQKEWLSKIQKDFNKYGISSKVRSQIQKERFIRGVKYPCSNSYVLLTLSYPQLIECRNRWYPNGIKKIPLDIIISPVFMANWYMGDGSKSNKLVFHTESFTEENVINFINKLNYTLNCHFTLSHKESKPLIQLARKQEVKRILDYMSPFMVECFNYKWRM